MADNINPREIVLDILVDIDKNNRLSNLTIQSALKKHQFATKQDRAFITRMCEGVIEYKLLLDYIVNQYSNMKINKCKPVIRNILRMGVYQLKFMDSIPDAATCNEAVKLAKKKKFTTLAPFVNGVLRNIARDIENVKYPSEIDEPNIYLSVMYSMPEWLVDKLVKDYDYHTVKGMLEASMADRPTTIRCNEKNISIDMLTKKLEEHDIQVSKADYIDSALHISHYDNIRRTPGFLDGDFVVQDESSMLVGLIANPKSSDFIMDVCSAPGGKSLHLAELMKDSGKILSRDITEEKVNLIEDNIDRCGYKSIECEVRDALDFDEELREQADILIADLPCSGLGIIGKKNDIKYRLSKEQLDELVKLQQDILLVVKDYVKPGGTLIYSTCTVNLDENINNAKWFVEHSEFEFDSIEEYVPTALECKTGKEGYINLVPGQVKCDGFFVARFKKMK